MNARITPSLFCISTRLAILWAGLGIRYNIIVSFGSSHLVQLVKE